MIVKFSANNTFALRNMNSDQILGISASVAGSSERFLQHADNQNDALAENHFTWSYFKFNDESRFIASGDGSLSNPARTVMESVECHAAGIVHNNFKAASLKHCSAMCE